MKFLFTLFIISLFISMSGFVFAANQLNDATKTAVEVIVRDSDGQLVAYLQLDRFSVLNTESFEKFIEKEDDPEDPIINVGGEKFRKIIRTKSTSFEVDQVISSTILADYQNGVFFPYGYFEHDGYFVTNGDKLKTSWTFFKPVD